MGMDATGYFVTKRALSDAEIDRVLADWKDAHRMGDSAFTFVSLRDDSDFTPQCIEIRFDRARHYSPGYARGPFYEIWSVLGWLRRRPYVEAVYYGGDSGSLNELGEYNDDREREMSDCWLTSGHDTYRHEPPQRFT